MKKFLERQIEYLCDSAEGNWGAALVLFKSKRYDACLFFCHLVLEKLLKGLVIIHTNDRPPYIHDLEKLARIAALELTDEQRKNFSTITTFNIATRYDEEKYLFYKKCTKPYTQKYLKISEELYLWLKKQYPKK